MLEELSGTAFVEWQEFARLEPFGGRRDDLRTALIVSTCFNMWKGKDAAAVTPEKVFPDSLGMQPGERKRRRWPNPKRVNQQIRSFFASRRAAMVAAAGNDQEEGKVGG